MKKIVLMIVAATTLAATVSAPADAHRLRVGRAGGAIAAAAVAAVATEALVYGSGYGPGYYYAPTPLYYGASPVILPYGGPRYRW